MKKIHGYLEKCKEKLFRKHIFFYIIINVSQNNIILGYKQTHLPTVATESKHHLEIARDV